MGFGSSERAGTVELVAGEPRALEVEFVPGAPSLGGLSIGCLPPSAPDLMDRAVALAARADAVVVVVGTDGDWETEGNDRESMALPPPQDDLVRAVAAANPRTVVVVNAASPVEMPWAEDVDAIMQCWFAGEEWGNALADVLAGDVSPSGKLPTTIPHQVQDAPAFKSYPGADGRVVYDEGVLVGYRWYDARGIEPRFCFGHGLSYTSFDLGAPVVDGSGPDLQLRVPVTNTGPVRGAEVVQCYVHDVDASVERPAQELKAFAKVWLDPGEIAGRRARARCPFVLVLGHGECRVEVGARRVRVTHRHVVARDRPSRYRQARLTRSSHRQARDRRSRTGVAEAADGRTAHASSHSPPTRSRTGVAEAADGRTAHASWKRWR